MTCPNPRDEMLRRVQQLDFAVVELNLFLDTHPRCAEAFCVLKQYLALAREARRAYERDYGPLTLEHVECGARYDWIDHPWPWEMEA